MVRDGMKGIAVLSHQQTERRGAQIDRLFEHRGENRREVAGRGVDDLQHLGGCGLLLSRISEFASQRITSAVRSSS